MVKVLRNLLGEKKVLMLDGKEICWTYIQVSAWDFEGLLHLFLKFIENCCNSKANVLDRAESNTKTTNHHPLQLQHGWRDQGLAVDSTLVN